MDGAPKLARVPLWNVVGFPTPRMRGVEIGPNCGHKQYLQTTHAACASLHGGHTRLKRDLFIARQQAKAARALKRRGRTSQLSKRIPTIFMELPYFLDPI